ncbi:proton-conducting transporter membrane subunit [Gottschalkia purinilytica]|nr:proton-conducting transporter membrane subunit [Gottschalkia purinilytica]
MMILLPIVFPVVTSLVIYFLKDENKKKRNVFLTISSLISILFSILVLKYGNNTELDLFKINNFFHFYLRIDKLGLLFSMLVSVLCAFSTFYSIEYMSHEGREKRCFILLTITLGVTIGIAFSGNLFTFYVFYELLTLITFMLITHRKDKKSFESGKKYLIYSILGSIFIVISMIMIYNITRNLEFIEYGVFNNIYSYSKNKLLFMFLIMFLGFGVKTAIVPFHSWILNIISAPTPISSILDAVIIVKTGVFALIRISYFIFGSEVIKYTDGSFYISILIGITILLGSLLALHYDDLKKRLVYSTVSQLGYILLGIVLLNEKALVGGLLHLINHAILKIILFFCVGVIYYQTGKKSIKEIEGIGREMPITMWCFGIAAISLVGIPPTNGFVSKWYLGLGGLAGNKVFFVGIILISGFLTATYLLPIIVKAFFVKSNKAIDKIDEVEKVKEAPMRVVIPIVMLTGIAVFLGLFPNIILGFIEDIVKGIV